MTDEDTGSQGLQGLGISRSDHTDEGKGKGGTSCPRCSVVAEPDPGQGLLVPRALLPLLHGLHS